MLRFKINAQADVTAAAEIYIYGDIGDNWWEESTSAADFIKQLEQIGNQQINVRINSIGGSVPDGIAIYHALRRHPAKVTTSIDGMAYSISSLIPMAGDHREMSEGAWIMIHAPWAKVAGNAAALRKSAEVLDQWAESMASIHAATSSLSEEQIKAILTDGEDHYFSASEALASGLIDSIVPAMDVAAAYRVPEAALSRFDQSERHISEFTIETAQAGHIPGDPVMNREAKIRAAFKAHLAKEGVNELLAACIADESISVEDAQARLDSHLSGGAPNAGGSDNGPGSDPQASATDGVTPEAIAAQAVAAESKRRNDIEDAFEPFGQDPAIVDVMKACLRDTTVTVDIANARLLSTLGTAGEPVASGLSFSSLRNGHSPSGEDRFKEDGVACILARAGKADDETRVKASKSTMRHASLLDFARMSLDRAGVSYGMMDSMGVVGAAITQSTSDFPVLLEEAMHKAMQTAYRSRGDTWSLFCAIGSVSDFRAHHRYRSGSIGNFNVVNENGEFETKMIPDGERSSVSVDTRGAIINLTRKMIVNDDLGAFINVAANAGRSASRTIEAMVYALLGEGSGLGPLLSDGKRLFHADHGNIGSSAALSVASLEADRVLMASQKDVSGNEFLDIRPDALLCPLAQGGNARVINDAQYDPDTADKLQKPNMVRGLFKQVVDTPRLTGNRRYMFADPNEAPVLEVSFLNGVREPQMEMQEAFTVDGTSYRARLDVGVDAIDYRGAVTNGGGS